MVMRSKIGVRPVAVVTFGLKMRCIAQLGERLKSTQKIMDQTSLSLFKRYIWA